MEADKTNGWAEWGKHVLKELESLNDYYKEQQREMQGIRVDIATLKVKSTLFGALAGGIPSLGLLVAWIIKNVK